MRAMLRDGWMTGKSDTSWIKFSVVFSRRECVCGPPLVAASIAHVSSYQGFVVAELLVIQIHYDIEFGVQHGSSVAGIADISPSSVIASTLHNRYSTRLQNQASSAATPGASSPNMDASLQSWLEPPPKLHIHK